LTGSPVIIIDNNDDFFRTFPTLDQPCIINCRLRLAPGEEHLLVELLERGTHLIPSASAQLASRSKAHQVRIFSDFMLPGTCVLYSTHDLLAAISRYNGAGIGEVVVKRDRKNGGIGIHRFQSLEELHNFAVFGTLEFPLIIQPFIERFRDIRVIAMGDYWEAYERGNLDNFRHNLHCGGRADPCELSDELRQFCSQVMERGRFPYAHLDLMELGSDRFYLTEINLRGGLRGAIIDARTYRRLLDDLTAQLLEEMVARITATVNQKRKGMPLRASP